MAEEVAVGVAEEEASSEGVTIIDLIIVGIKIGK